MNKNYTEIAFVLDRSGSMQSCQEATIDGFNYFLREQQALEGLAKLTLILFDDEYLVLFRSLPVAEILPLDCETYLPRGSTALLDAIGQTIDDLGARLAALDENARPAQVIVAILTDGLENASTRFTWKQVSRRIKHQTKEYQWTFLFLGANQDAIATAGQLSIAARNAATYAADDAGLRSLSPSLSRKVRSLRQVASRLASPQERSDAAASMSELVEEEDRKERGK